MMKETKIVSSQHPCFTTGGLGFDKSPEGVYSKYRVSWLSSDQICKLWYSVFKEIRLLLATRFEFIIVLPSDAV